MENLAVKTSSLSRKIGALLLTLKARCRRQGFVCNSLQGCTQFSVCVNSDLTLSCSYRDLDGSGHVGDLAGQSFEEAFLGPDAQSFREQLAAGRLPTPNCVRCRYLRAMPKPEARQMLAQVAMPKAVMLENTSLCNLHCLSCRRDTVKRMRKRRRMSLDDVRKVAADLAQIGVNEITFHHLGEPFMSGRVLDELTILRDHNPNLRLVVSTNGMLVDTDSKREAALLFDSIYFSLDGIDQEMAARYQRGIQFDRVLQNLTDLVAYRGDKSSPRIVWKYLLFRWNERRKYQLRAIEMAREAGADEIRFEKTVSPFYGLPWRSHLGSNRDLGVDFGFARHVTLREEPAPAVEPSEQPRGQSGPAIELSVPDSCESCEGALTQLQ